MAVPFNRPYLTGGELDLLADVIESRRLAGGGPFSERCTRHLESRLGAGRAFLTHTATGALELAAMLAGVGPGDEVIMPSFTFPTTASPFVLRGATPVFTDIREDTLNLDERLVESAIGERTAAIVPVHYGGVACELDALGDLAQGPGAALIEDAAHAIGATWRGRPLGSFGDAAALSFHETKNVTSGEGGALLLNRPDWAERAEILHERGTNRAAFERGEVAEYHWSEVGSSFRPSELEAAFLWAQLEAETEITADRLATWNRYHAAFEELEAAGRIRRPVIPEGAGHNAHLYYLLLPDRAARDALIAGLADAEIGAVFHYVPLHSSPAGRRHGRASGELPVTESVSARLVRLPLWAGMGEAEVEEVTDAVDGVLAGAMR